MLVLLASVLVLSTPHQQLDSLTDFRSTGYDVTRQSLQGDKKDPADALLARIQGDFGNLSVTRKELQERLEKFVIGFPASHNHNLAMDYLATLRLMAKEEMAHNLRPPIPWAKMSDSEKVEELIYQLRDTNARPFFSNSRCDVLFDSRNKESAAHKLVAMGYAAVPQLIELLGDKRLTRSTEEIDGVPFKSAVLPFGEAANQILGAIAKTNFAPWFVGAGRTQEEAGKERRKNVLAWWSELHQKGEKQLLIDSLRSGKGSVERAQLLAKKYPKDAAAPIGEAIMKMGNHETTEPDYIVVLADCGTAEAKAIARKLMKGAPSLRQRAVAASVVARSDLPGALAAMEKEWINLRVQEYTFGPETLATFLLNSGHPGAVRTLAKDLRTRPIWLRGDVVHQILDPEGTGMDALARFAQPGGALAAKYRTEVANLLASELQDVQRYDTFSMSSGDVELDKPRLADLAAFGLSTLRPDLFKFAPGQTPAQLEVQRRRFISIWKKERGKAG